MRFFLIIILLVASLVSSSQGKMLRREIQFENDNDAYTLNLTRDQYYSNGIILRYRHLKDSAKWKPSFEKSIRSYVFNHRIYTPEDIAWRDSSRMDRPYAGQISFSILNEYYFKNNSYIYTELELGWMGPALRMGDLQYGWHKTFGMELPKGWRFQINDSPIVNFYGKYARTWLDLSAVDIGTQSNIALGTAFGHARQEIVFRFGNFLPLHQSTQNNGGLGRINNGPKQYEIYFFLSPGIEYVGYNSTIEGGFIGEESIFTKDKEEWVTQIRAGFLMSFTQFDFGLIYYRRTKETTEATYHKYVGIRMSQRF